MLLDADEQRRINLEVNVDADAAAEPVRGGIDPVKWPHRQLRDPANAMERFTISLDDRLAEQFDAWISKRSYSNRSEAVRDLLRAELGKTALQAAATQHCVACLSYVFNHHERQLVERLANLQHDHHELTISTMHAHLDHEHCLETVLLRGKVSEVKHFADEVCAERGVHHGKLNLISVDMHEPHDRSPAKGRQATAVTPHIHLKPTT